MTRQEKIFSTFAQAFSKYVDKKIVLYGIGSYTDWIINKCKEIPIAGIIDRWQSTGEIYGKPILTYPDILREKINVIIISASIHNTKIIYKRISDFCDDNFIELYDLEGELLNSVSPDLSFKSKEPRNRFYDCREAIITKSDEVFWKPIEEHFFSNKVKTDSLGRVILQSSYDIGYLFLGAIVSDFLFWMIDKAKALNVEEIIFTARDGYLFKKIYDKIREWNTALPPAIYLLTSRYVCIMSGIKTFNDILHYSRVNFTGDIYTLLKQRFFLKEEEIARDIQGATNEKILKSHEKVILDRASEIREWYINYLAQEGLMKVKKRAVFDLAASGTCQQVLEKLSGQTMYGLYMLQMYTEDKSKRSLHIDFYHLYEEEFARRSMFMESILTSLYPTLKYVGADRNPVYADESRTEEELAFVKEAQTGIEEYFNCVVDNMKKRDISYEPSQIPVTLYNHVTSHYSIIENEVFKKFVLKDEVFGEQNWLLHKIMV